jgi:BlaI family penicillinase repressor
MARPRVKELTQRELEIMHVFWRDGGLTVTALRDRLALSGPNLAYTTVATLVKILVDKGYLRPTGEVRPFVYKPKRSYAEVSRRILGDVVERVFHGSRTLLLLQLMEDDHLSETEKSILKRLAEERKP